MSNYQSRFREMAKSLLNHYFRLVAENCDVRWNWENEQEVESIVDNIISAVKDELEIGITQDASDLRLTLLSGGGNSELNGEVSNLSPKRGDQTGYLHPLHFTHARLPRVEARRIHQ